MSEEEKGVSMLRGTVKASGAPVGNHRARFVDCVLVERSERAIAEGWSEQIKLVFQLENSDLIATRYCNANAGPKTATLPLLQGLLDRPLKAGEEWDLSECVGRLYKITCEEAGTGTRVSSISLID